MENNCILCGRDETVFVKMSGPSRIVLCRSCGVAYRNPDMHDDLMFLRTPKSKEERISYAEGFHEGQKYFNQYLLKRGAMTRKPPGKLLDVGCGFGDMIQLACDAGWDACGLDISEEGVEICREKGLTAYCGTIESLGLEAESFDAVTIRGVIEYLKDPLGELKHIHRILKPGGIMMARTLNLTFHLATNGVYQKLEPAFQKMGIKNPSTFHRFAFSSKSLKTLVGKAGFNMIECGPSPMGRGDPYSYAEKPALKKLFSMYTFVNDFTGFIVYYGSGKNMVITPSAITICQKPEKK